MRTKPDDPVELRIELPLPTDVAATLMRIIGLTYPNTQIATAPESSWRPRDMVLVIDPKDRNRKPKARKRYREALQELDEQVAQVPWLTELDANGVSVSPHEMLCNMWVGMAKRMFEDNPDATNYLETTLRDKESGQEYVFHVAKSQGQTPHALRRKAEDRYDDLDRQLRSIHFYVLDCCDEYVCGNCGQNPCPTLAALGDDQDQVVTT